MDQNKLKVDGELFPSGAFNWYHEGSASVPGNFYRLEPSNTDVVFTG
ncbi:MAG: hypothetical protein IPL22_10440 [Bacteroidetes bacterium]|nr:hypothetical protein [Bacteroidota bacterium]